MPEEIKFEDALKKLEKIVETLESGDVGLDDSLKKYEEGVRLLRLCTIKLEEAEKMLREALQLSREANAAPAITATLQQLGRVRIRKAQFVAARAALEEALSLQTAEVYLSGVHVNVAAVRHQLGVLARRE